MVDSVGKTWWQKKEEVYGYDCSLQQPKPSIHKNMNIEDRKKLNKALTYHYIKEQADGDDRTKEITGTLTEWQN
jgi:hypothetical protein